MNQVLAGYAYVLMPAHKAARYLMDPLHISIRRCLLSTAAFCQ